MEAIDKIMDEYDKDNKTKAEYREQRIKKLCHLG